MLRPRSIWSHRATARRSKALQKVTGSVRARSPSHDQATEVCHARGAELAAVSSPEENSFLASTSREIGTHTNLWIGGTRDDEHVWRWPDGTEFWRGLVTGAAPVDTYANWQSGEPNDTSTVTDEPERCAAMALFDDGWRDRACLIELSYLCELR
jgi:Lectin C-type domain